MKVHIISRIIGLVLLVNAGFMALSAIVSAIYGFDTGFTPLLLSAILTATVGFFPLIFVRRTDTISAREGNVVVCLAWISSCLFGMLPYVLWGNDFFLVNAWFESVSGYTTTGATIVRNVETLPHSMLFWRACTHWIGGIGVVMFMVLILPHGGASRSLLAKMEIASFRQNASRFQINRIIYNIAGVYFSLTLTECLLLCMCGINFFDAVCQSFSTMATGGFSSRNASVASFQNPVAEAIIGLFMFLAGSHFGLMYLALSGKPRTLLKDPVFRYYTACMLTVTLLIALNLWISDTCGSFGESFRYAYFQTISMGTSTGFVTHNSNTYPLFSILLLNLLSIQCACSGSTTGGLKADRVRIFFAAMRAQLIHAIHPRSVEPVRLGGGPIDSDTVHNTIMYIVLYLFILAAGALVLCMTGLGGQESFTISLSNIGNVGVAFGEIGNAVGNYDGLSVVAKMVSTVQMLIGRVEILVFFSLFLILARK